MDSAQLSEAFKNVEGNQLLLRRLRQATEDRVVTLANVHRFLGSTPKYKRLTVLIDFDVLVAFIESSGSSHRDLPFISHFFLHSSLPFGLPPGSYRELIQYLRKSRYLPEEIIEALGKREAIDKIPSVANLIYQFVDGEEDFVLRHRLLKIKRLLSVLTSARYRREIAAGSAAAEDEMLRTLGSQERYKFITTDGKVHKSIDVFRSERDINDAGNLAAAFQMITDNAEKDEWEDYYLLLTKTQVVDTVSKQRRVMDGFWLSVDPELLFYADVCGCARRSRALLNVGQTKEMLEELRNLLASLQGWGKNPVFDYYRDAVMKRASSLLDGLRSVAQEILTGIFPRFEASFATVESSRVNRDLSSEQYESEEQMAPVEFRLHYTKQVEYLVASLEGNPDVKYSVIDSPKESGRSVVVCSNKRLYDQTFSITRRGEVCNAHWSVCATDNYFSQVANKLFGSPEEAWSGESLSDVWAGEVTGSDNPVLQEGIVWYTPLGVFGARPGRLLTTHSWQILRVGNAANLIGQCARALLRPLGKPQVYSSFAEMTIPLLGLDQVRVSTKRRVMLFDYVQVPQFPDRRCSVTCAASDMDWIGEAYYLLGVKFCKKDAFISALKTIP